MNKKRAQVTIFIILALVMVAGVLIYFLIGNASDKKDYVLSSEATQVKSHVDACLEESVINTLFINGLNAGYYIENIDVFEDYSTSSDNFYYFLYEEENTPSLEDLEEQISIGIEKEILNCLNDSQFYFEVNYNVDSLDAESFLSKDRLMVDIFLPVSIQSNSSDYLVEEFSIEKRTNYLDFYNLAKNLTSEQLSHPEKVCLSCMSDFSLNKGLDIEFYESSEEEDYEIIYYVYDLQERGDMFSFAHKFKLEEL